MFKRLRTVVLFFLCLLAFSVVLLSESKQVAAQANPESEDSEYPSIGKREGVWNNGQAALWDLNVLDHFHYFGPKERARGHKPEQPIAFSHVRHVQMNKMDCQYCHWTVAKSEYAAVPEVETCLGCHKFVKGTTPEQKQEINKIFWFSENSGIPFYLDEAGAPLKDEQGVFITPAGEQVKGPDGAPLKQQTGEAVPIPWVKVHVTPNYVKFNHKRHVKAGVGCESCHGQVPEMDVVERVSSMKMGWCVSCHRAEGASIDCATCHY